MGEGRKKDWKRAKNKLQNIEILIKSQHKSKIILEPYRSHPEYKVHLVRRSRCVQPDRNPFSPSTPSHHKRAPPPPLQPLPSGRAPSPPLQPPPIWKGTPSSTHRYLRPFHSARRSKNNLSINPLTPRSLSGACSTEARGVNSIMYCV